MTVFDKAIVSSFVSSSSPLSKNCLENYSSSVFIGKEIARILPLYRSFLSLDSMFPARKQENLLLRGNLSFLSDYRQYEREL